MKKGKVLLGFAALGSLLLSSGLALADVPAVQMNGEEPPAYREGELIVKYRDGVMRTFNQTQNAYNRINVVNVERFEGETFQNFESLQIDTSRITVDEAVADLERDPSVEYVQPNYILYAHDAAPTPAEDPSPRCWAKGFPYPLGCKDEGEPEQAAPVEARAPSRGPASISAAIPASGPAILKAPAEVTGRPDPSLNKAWGISKIGATTAWNQNKGSKRVIVAAPVSGVDYNHPDLAANMWRNPSASRTLATGVDAQGSSVTGDIVGWDFVQNDNRPYDISGHGTHCAGTIGAVGGNGVGVSGVNQKVSIMAVRFLNGQGKGGTSDAIKAIDYAISRGAKVLNNSWGGKGSVNRALRDAISRSERAGALFVASAGNDGTNNDRSPSYPASYTDIPNVISVAATSSSDALGSFSNYGAKSVHVGAPGVSIYSTRPGNSYGYMSGTSMAGPHVAGAAALLWAQNPGASYAEIKRRLLNSGDVVSSLAGKTITGRRINVQRAMQMR